MTIESRIEALKVKLAEKYSEQATHSGLAKPSLAFTAGASALAEVYQLKGKINATWEIASRCKQNGPTRDYGRALERDVTEMQARLEELISAVEEQA